MKMRARTFFAFYREAERLQAKEYREQLRIARTPSMVEKYYEYLDRYYSGLIEPDKKIPDLPPAPPRPGMDPTTTETKNALIHMFSRARTRGKLTPYGRQ